MKAEELMIGDRVLAEGKPVQVTNISVLGGDIIRVISPFMSYDVAYASNIVALSKGAKDINKIEPIPLTKEILEKNGYSYNENREGWEQIPNDGFGICKDIDDNCFYFCVGIFDAFNRYSNITYHHITKIEYVHELQHALKLCGIEKEIVL